MGTPALAWGGMLLPNGIERIGTVCCGVQSQDDQQEPQEGQELNRTCCCKPAPVPPAVDSAYRAPHTKDELSYLAPLVAGGVLDVPPVKRLGIAATHRSARAPPLSRPLLAQRTSFQI